MTENLWFPLVMIKTEMKIFFFLNLSNTFHNQIKEQSAGHCWLAKPRETSCRACLLNQCYCARRASQAQHWNPAYTWRAPWETLLLACLCFLKKTVRGFSLSTVPTLFCIQELWFSLGPLSAVHSTCFVLHSGAVIVPLVLTSAELKTRGGLICGCSASQSLLMVSF